MPVDAAKGIAPSRDRNSATPKRVAKTIANRRRFD